MDDPWSVTKEKRIVAELRCNIRDNREDIEGVAAKRGAPRLTR
jgi:hypothetical protein